MSGTTITGRLVLPSAHDGDERPAARDPSRRPARVAQLLALAHRWQEEVDAGEVAGQGAIAVREGITPARVSQVRRLLRLAPEIQEQVLMMVAVNGVEALTERALRRVASSPAWDDPQLAAQNLNLA